MSSLRIPFQSRILRPYVSRFLGYCMAQTCRNRPARPGDCQTCREAAKNSQADNKYNFSFYSMLTCFFDTGTRIAFIVCGPCARGVCAGRR